MRLDERARAAAALTAAIVLSFSLVGTVAADDWKYDPEISWYGPDFYGKRTACGLALTTSLIGVAHRSLPCGTLVEFRWEGKVIEAPVVDRGPYVSGRIWDLTGGACTALDHCFTGPIEWRFVSGSSRTTPNKTLPPTDEELDAKPANVLCPRPEEGERPLPLSGCPY